jgi:hypothetical protein
MRGRRKVLVAGGAAVVALLIGMATGYRWWFQSSDESPRLQSGRRVVQGGTWDGRAWQLVAYRSEGYGLCMSIKAANRRYRERASSCSPFVGIEQFGESKTAPQVPITALAGAATGDLPGYIVGAVIEPASVVDIRLTGSQALRMSTIAGPEPLQDIRFFAAPLPAELDIRSTDFLDNLSIAGRNPSGAVVACFRPRTASNGVSPLSDCR